MLEEFNYGFATINEISYLALNKSNIISDFEYKKNGVCFELYKTKDGKELALKYKVDSMKNGLLELTTSVRTPPHDSWTMKKALFQFFKTDEKNVKTISCLGWKLIK